MCTITCATMCTTITCATCALLMPHSHCIAICLHSQYFILTTSHTSYYIVAMFSHSQTMSGQRPPSGTISGFSLHILKWVIASCFGVSVLVRCCIAGVKRTILKVKMVPKEQNLNSDITAWSVREQSRSERDRICSFPSTYLQQPHILSQKEKAINVFEKKCKT